MHLIDHNWSQFQENINPHIRKISEGSCDIKGWSNGCCKNVSFTITRIKYILDHIKIEKLF